MEANLERALDKVHWLGHDAFRMDAETGKVYIDPFQLPENAAKARLVMITHDHFDHYSPVDLEKIVDEHTDVIAPLSTAKQLDYGKVHAVKPGDDLSIENINIKAVPSYNIGKDFHPKGNAWVGYLFTINGVAFYHAGDSDFIPEMKVVKTDIALLPVSGTYVMTAVEAAQAALAIKPKLAIPMHYGSIVGEADDARQFVELLAGEVEVKILNKG
jgi:L-ascorbate metabolism protein UlaG (beta-lactamase superfamily)